MGVALASTLDEGESFATLELHINFLRPVWDARLTAKGRIVSRGRTVAMTACDIADQGPRHIATVTGTQMFLTEQMATGRTSVDGPPVKTTSGSRRSPLGPVERRDQ